jgi:hypothetical protein
VWKERNKNLVQQDEVRKCLYAGEERKVALNVNEENNHLSAIHFNF